MTYNEWRDELKSNLLCVPEHEMARVLDYYAEAYADRRDAGYSENEIIAEFGAPYDAARRILSEGTDEYLMGALEPQPQSTQNSSQYAQQKTSDKTWVFVLLCVIFAAPIFGIFMALVGITIGFSVAPFALLVAGVGAIGVGIVQMFFDITLGACAIGMGLISFGMGLILAPIFIKVVKLLWKLLTKLFLWIKSLFSGKERA